jgi:hypothetical protein
LSAGVSSSGLRVLSDIVDTSEVEEKRRAALQRRADHTDRLRPCQESAILHQGIDIER